MFSLLTDTHKKELIKEYRLRLGVMIVAALLALMAIMIILLLPTYLRLKGDNDAALEEVTGIQKQLSGDANPQITAAMSDMKQNLPIATLDGRSAVVPIEKAIGDKAPGISLVGFTYKYDPAGSTLIIKGVADSREDLKKYGSNLSADQTFKQVDLPISNFAKASDLDFSISVSGLF